MVERVDGGVTRAHFAILRLVFNQVYYCIAVWGEKKHYCIAVLSVAISAQDPFWLEYFVARAFCTIWKSL